MRMVSNNPFLPKPGAGDPPVMGLFVRCLTAALTDIVFRLNALLPKDGTEAMEKPLVLATYTVATLPTAADWTGGIVYVSNGTSNKRLAVSNGTLWKFPDGNTVT